MALKHNITKSEYDLMPDDVKAHYLQDRNADTFSLALLGENPQVTQLNAQLGAQGVQLQKVSAELATANHQLKQADAAAETKYKTQLDTATNTIALMRDGSAQAERTKIVGEIAERFTKPELFSALIAGRVKVEYDKDGVLTTKFLSKDGNTEITKEALTDEYCKDPAYSDMLKRTTTVTMGNQAPITPAGTTTTPPATSQGVTYDSTGRATVNYAVATAREIADAYAANHALDAAATT